MGPFEVAIYFMKACLGIVGLGTAAFAVHRYFRYRERRLQIESGARQGQLLEAEIAQRKLLEERIQTLEAIVTSKDFETQRQFEALADGGETRSRLPRGSEAPPALAAGEAKTDQPPAKRAQR